tara:strand:- start:3156 stop:3665 length:510 start_codon:yes stop_codon:yes gene_type:complete
MTRYEFLGLTIPQMTAAIGFLMITTGLVFWITTGFITALFPSLFGTLMLISSMGSKMRPEKNALYMHIAVLCSLSALILGSTAILMNPDWSSPVALLEQTIMAILGGTHFSASIASFRFGSPDDLQTERRCGHEDNPWAIPASNNTLNYPSVNDTGPIAASVLLTSPRK